LTRLLVFRGRQHTVARWETGQNEPKGANLKALKELAAKAKSRAKRWKG